MKTKRFLFSGLNLLALLLTACSNGNEITSQSQTQNNSSSSRQENTQSSELPAHEHKWGNPTYTWTTDYSSCTAERLCSIDSTHKETETKASVYTIPKPAGCETEGQGLYTVTFVNNAFSPQTHNVVLSQTNHSWGEPTFEWSADYSQCIATRVCLNDSAHIETETVNSTYDITVPTTEGMKWLAKYTAIFANIAFKTQVIEKIYYGETPFLSKDEKTIIYGLYPKKNVNNSSLISALNALTKPESNGWYFYEDEYYAKAISENLYDPSTPGKYTFDNGNSITIGELYWFKCEPIVWRVINHNDDGYFVISRDLVDGCCYYHDHNEIRTIDGENVYANNYKYSDVREFLNNSFYNSAFALGNNYIETTYVDNSAATTNDIENNRVCQDTKDKVFLPSYKDYINSNYDFSDDAYNNDTERRCKTTDWARLKSAGGYSTDESYLYNGYYWTRSPCTSSNGLGGGYAFTVNYNGRLIGISVENIYRSVRPAITIKIV